MGGLTQRRKEEGRKGRKGKGRKGKGGRKKERGMTESGIVAEFESTRFDQLPEEYMKDGITRVVNGLPED